MTTTRYICCSQECHWRMPLSNGDAAYRFGIFSCRRVGDRGRVARARRCKTSTSSLDSPRAGHGPGAGCLLPRRLAEQNGRRPAAHARRRRRSGDQAEPGPRRKPRIRRLPARNRCATANGNNGPSCHAHPPTARTHAQPGERRAYPGRSVARRSRHNRARHTSHHRRQDRNGHRPHDGIHGGRCGGGLRAVQARRDQGGIRDHLGRLRPVEGDCPGASGARLHRWPGGVRTRVGGSCPVCPVRGAAAGAPGQHPGRGRVYRAGGLLLGRVQDGRRGRRSPEVRGSGSRARSRATGQRRKVPRRRLGNLPLHLGRDLPQARAHHRPTGPRL